MAEFYQEHYRLVQESVILAEEHIDLLRCRGRGQENSESRYADALDRERKEEVAIKRPENRKAKRGDQQCINGQPQVWTGYPGTEDAGRCMPLWENVAFNPRPSYSKIIARLEDKKLFFSAPDVPNWATLSHDRLIGRATRQAEAWSALFAVYGGNASNMTPVQKGEDGVTTDGSTTELEYMHPWDEVQVEGSYSQYGEKHYRSPLAQAARRRERRDPLSGRARVQAAASQTDTSHYSAPKKKVQPATSEFSVRTSSTRGEVGFTTRRAVGAAPSDTRGRRRPCSAELSSKQQGASSDEVGFTTHRSDVAVAAQEGESSSEASYYQRQQRYDTPRVPGHCEQSVEPLVLSIHQKQRELESEMNQLLIDFQQHARSYRPRSSNVNFRSSSSGRRELSGSVSSGRDSHRERIKSPDRRRDRR